MKNSMEKRTFEGLGFSGSWAPIALIALGLGLGIQGCSNESSLEPQTPTFAVAARGSSAMPVDIRTLSELRSMTTSGNYRLAADITMSSSDAAFLPIGNIFEPFQGTFDGGGYKISNLRINGPDGYYLGLFSSTNGAILNRVRLDNVNIKAGSVSGAIVGYMVNTLLTDSYVNGGTVAGSTNTNSYGYALGMAIGTATDRSEIYRCQARGTVTGVTTSIGGFAGELYSWGEVNGSIDPRVIVQEVFTNVDVNPTKPANSSEVTAGGLAGKAQGVVIQDINCAGPVKGWGPAGGVIGHLVYEISNGAPSNITQVVSLGKVTSNRTPDRAGVVGALTGHKTPGFRCGSSYNKETDAGTALSLDDIDCNVGRTAAVLRGAYFLPNKMLKPYIIGAFIDAQFRIDHPGTPSCKLGSGSDGDWGFGSCSTTPIIWRANPDNQYSTLVRIPDPGAQPL